MIMMMIMLLTGCGVLERKPDPIVIREPVRVEIPVPVRATPPAELLAPLQITPPAFVAPTDPRASSALTPEGEKALRMMLLEMGARLSAWQAWAATP